MPADISIDLLSSQIVSRLEAIAGIADPVEYPAQQVHFTPHQNSRGFP